MTDFRELRCATDQDALANLVTLSDWARFAQSNLNAHQVKFGQGFENARDEAVYIVLNAAHLHPNDWEQNAGARLTEGEKNKLLGWLKDRCIKRKPLPYITGEAWLGGERFICDERALIPRSLIAELLTDQLSPWLEQPDSVSRILDLCTGGASLAILAAHCFPDATVVGSDISATALRLARENVALHGLSTVTLIESNLFSMIEPQKFDLILSNPPYVNSESMSLLPPEFLAEPQLALAGGSDGMNLVRRILSHAAAYLSDNGLLVIEIGYEAQAFEQTFAHLEYAWLPVAAGENMVVAISADALKRIRT
jgi:ribosomal protein L3 glutamine methyltransferase